VDNVYVLDSYALIAHLENEPAGLPVGKMLKAAKAGKVKLFFSVVNFGEVYYTALRERGVEMAEDVRVLIEQLPLAIEDADRKLTLEAARLKAGHAVAYADCFAAALALQKRAKVVTGDPEFRKFEGLVGIHWLTN
jgi:ribonuclease VapC